MTFESYFEDETCVGWWKLYHPNLISGWLVDKQTRRHKTIAIQIGDYMSNPIEANEFRGHVAGREGADGFNGFRHRIPPEIMAADAIEIDVLDVSRGMALNTAHFDLIAFRQAETERMIFPPGDASRYKGWVGNLDGGRITGWIIENQGVHTASSIRISVGDYVSEEIIADEPREHLKNRGVGAGNFGFSASLPTSLAIADNPKIRVLTADFHPTGIEADLELRQIQPGVQRKATRSRFPRSKQEDAVLLWCPIANSGLTTQLFQVTEILRRLGVKYYVSYHVSPTIDCAEVDRWIDPADIDSPKVAIFFERFVPFERGFDGAYKVFYVNLDWLNDHYISVARTYADLILAPVTYRLDYLKEEFRNQPVLHMPWPSIFDGGEEPPGDAKADAFINILYMGNEYDDISRKHPKQVVDAVLENQNSQLRFTLKFRTRLDPDLRARLAACACVAGVHDTHMSEEEVAALYAWADIGLMPNECEGNGLTILEAWEKNVAPAVLDGHPMKDVVDADNAFLLECEQFEWREKTPAYRMSKETLLTFFHGLDPEAVRAKRDGVARKRRDLKSRGASLEKMIGDICFNGGGVRNRDRRALVDRAHDVVDESDVCAAQSLLFGDTAASNTHRVAENLHILMTTSKRPFCLRQSLSALISAIESTDLRCDLFLHVDGADDETLEIVGVHREKIASLLVLNEAAGLPYAWNNICAASAKFEARTERRADYVLYLQDDCRINDPDTYLDRMVRMADQAAPEFLGLVSGFHTEVHPGFGAGRFDGERILFSDSVDGKNFMGRRRLLNSIGPLTWWFSDGERRGNPGPTRGSHFDLWQWKESPNATSVQKRINIIAPDLTAHTAQSIEASTWGNDTTDSATDDRKKVGKIYDTRGVQT